jgi:hypothetical protein
MGGVAWTYYFQSQFIDLLLGFVGPFVAIIAVFVIWLEWDEWKIERELRAEEMKIESPKTPVRRRRGRPKKKK